MHTSRPVRGRSPHSRTLLAVLIGALLLVSACTASEDTTSGGEPTGDSSTTAVEQDSDAPVDAQTEASEAPLIPPSEPPTDGGGEQDGPNEIAGIDLNADYCEITRQAEEAGLFSGEGPQNPEDLAEAAEQARLVTEALVRQAPDEIAEDVEVSANNLSELLSVLEAHASRTGEVGAEVQEDPQIQAAIEALESEEVQEANDRVSAWERENC
jgi:hypothetical protein